MEKELNLHQRLLKIANIAGALQRTKEGYGYRYVPEEDIQALITEFCDKVYKEASADMQACFALLLKDLCIVDRISGHP